MSEAKATAYEVYRRFKYRLIQWRQGIYHDGTRCTEHIFVMIDSVPFGAGKMQIYTLQD